MDDTIEILIVEKVLKGTNSFRGFGISGTGSCWGLNEMSLIDLGVKLSKLLIWGYFDIFSRA